MTPSSTTSPKVLLAPAASQQQSPGQVSGGPQVAEETAPPRSWITTKTYWNQWLKALETPVVGTAAGPRLKSGQAGRDLKSPDGGARTWCDNYSPDWVSLHPMPAQCPELLDKGGGDEPVRTVGQSEGVLTHDWSVKSEKFTRCAAFLFLNEDLGQTLLIHYDSGARSRWTAQEQQEWGEPVSPATPTRELLGRERFGYTDFIKQEGHKRVLLIESQMAYDCRDVLRQMERDGVQLLKPLTLHTPKAGGEGDMAVWSMVYRPVTDELLIHMWAGSQTLLHFSNLMQQEVMPLPPRVLDGKAGPARRNLVDDLPLYRERLALVRKSADPAVVQLLGLCLDVAAAKSSNLKRAYTALRQVLSDPLVPSEIRKSLVQGKDIAAKDGLVMEALTDLADHLLDRQPGADTP